MCVEPKQVLYWNLEDGIQRWRNLSCRTETSVVLKLNLILEIIKKLESRTETSVVLKSDKNFIDIPRTVSRTETSVVLKYENNSE